MIQPPLCRREVRRAKPSWIPREIPRRVREFLPRFTALAGVARWWIVFAATSGGLALSPSLQGALDPAFQFFENEPVRPRADQPDGRIVVAGDFSTLSGQPRNRIGGLVASDELRIQSITRTGELQIAGVFTNGVCVVERAESVIGPWQSARAVYTTSTVARVSLMDTGSIAFYRALARDLGGGQSGFTNLTLSYGLLTTIAGAGGPQDVNNWQPQYEGAPAPLVRLSGPHMAMADNAGHVFIADKDAHGIRKIRLDGTIVTVAGINVAGNGTDAAAPGTTVALNEPNGLWVRGDGTLYVLDLGNGKVRRLDTNGLMQTLFTVPGGIVVGRGLWVNEEESLAYVASLTVVKQWTLGGGVVDFASGFIQLGNLVVDPWGQLVVSDRGTHFVYRLDASGQRTVIAGNGSTFGGGDGFRATETALNEVRGVWFLPNGGFFVATHRGSQVWYIDPERIIHLFLNGDRNGAHAGDGTWFYQPVEPRVSECRAVTVDPRGNLLITENDIGFVRKVEFLPLASGSQNAGISP